MQNGDCHLELRRINNNWKLIRVTGRNRSSKHPGVEKVYIKTKKGTILRPPTSMGHRCGYIISSYLKKEAKKFALEAAKEISFDLE